MSDDWRMIQPTPLFNEQVRKELKIPITHDKYMMEEDTCSIYYGTYIKLPDIYVQTEDGEEVLVHPTMVERVFLGTEHYILHAVPPGSRPFKKVRVTKWKVAKP